MSSGLSMMSEGDFLREFEELAAQEGAFAYPVPPHQAKTIESLTSWRRNPLPGRRLFLTLSEQAGTPRPKYEVVVCQIKNIRFLRSTNRGSHIRISNYDPPP
jgi:hypothetical protein